MAVAIGGQSTATPFQALFKYAPIFIGAIMFKVATELSGLNPIDRSNVSECLLTAAGFTAFVVLGPFLLTANESAIQLYSGPFSLLYSWLNPKIWLIVFLASTTVYRPKRNRQVPDSPHDANPV